MKPSADDLVVRFDAAEDKVVFLIRKSPENLGELKRFHEVKAVKKMSNQEMVKEFGAVVFSYLHATHDEQFAYLEE